MSRETEPAPAVLSWGRVLLFVPITPLSRLNASATGVLHGSVLHAIISRPPHAFIASCGSHWSARDSMWELFPGFDLVPGDRLCGECAKYALARHLNEATPHFVAQAHRSIQVAEQLASADACRSPQ